MVVPFQPWACWKPEFLVDDFFEERMLFCPLMEMVGGVWLPTTLLDGYVDEIHPAGYPVCLVL